MISKNENLLGGKQVKKSNILLFTAAALAVKTGTTVRKLDVSLLQRTLDKNGVNIGQSFRKIPALDEISNKFAGYGENTNG